MKKLTAILAAVALTMMVGCKKEAEKTGKTEEVKTEKKTEEVKTEKTAE